MTPTTQEDKIKAEGKAYANLNFESCRYSYSDDERITNFDEINKAFIAGATAYAKRVAELEAALRQCQSYLNSFKTGWKEGEEILDAIISQALTENK